MEYKIITNPNPLSHFDIIKSFKKILKPIKTDSKGKFIDKLFNHSEIMSECLSRNFTIQDIDLVNVKSDVYYNIPLTSLAWFGMNGGNHCIGEYDEEQGALTVFKHKKDLDTFLQSIYLPEKIEIKRLELNLEIMNTKSQFVFEM